MQIENQSRVDRNSLSLLILLPVLIVDMNLVERGIANGNSGPRFLKMNLFEDYFLQIYNLVIISGLDRVSDSFFATFPWTNNSNIELVVEDRRLLDIESGISNEEVEVVFVVECEDTVSIASTVLVLAFDYPVVPEHFDNIYLVELAPSPEWFVPILYSCRNQFLPWSPFYFNSKWS